MRIVKRGALLAVFFLSGMLLGMAKAWSDPLETCEGGVSCAPCAPCGHELADFTPTPGFEPTCASVNPLINYVATAERTFCRGYFGGFYLGAAYGAGIVNYRLRIEGVPFPFTPFPFILRNYHTRRGYLVTIFNGGFNLVYNYFFLGGELGYNYRSRTHLIDRGDGIDFLASTAIFNGVGIVSAQSFPGRVQLDINSQHAVTADILPGFVVDRFVAYLRLGIEQSRYTWSRRFCIPFITVNTLAPTPFTPNLITITNVDFAESISQPENGYRLGVGFGYAVGRHISFHLNYIHTFSNRLNFVPTVLPALSNVPLPSAAQPVLVTALTTVFIPQLAAENSIRPQRDEVNFGVKFRF
jgi:opacity protein-like surface antigen